uniref:Ig-like domain-containing protein n=1 Tax=Prolemur simus TaxID=1328070 RepID=A0A8C8ZLZ3_PROSS
MEITGVAGLQAILDFRLVTSPLVIIRAAPHFLLEDLPPSLPGGHNQPSLSAWPSPVVPLGGRVTLRCHSHARFVFLKIIKTVRSHISEFHKGPFKKSFMIKRVTTAHAGIYRCSGAHTRIHPVWSAVSDPLEIVVTGVFTKPSISAHPSSLVHPGSSVTLHCLSELDFDKFILHKKGITQHFQLPAKIIHAGLPYTQANFSIDTMTPTDAGTYTCYGSLSHYPCEWSAPSDPLDIVITGQYQKPSLSTQMGPMVGSGENVTLSCSSKTPFDKYHLSREGEARDHWLSGWQSHNGTFQVHVPLGTANPFHGGTYRCYGSFKGSPYEWSSPSDLLNLSVTGEDPIPAAYPGTYCIIELCLRGVLMRHRDLRFWTK